MARQIVNIGAAANDGTGDKLRAGGKKINDNFAELYLLAIDWTALSGATWDAIATNMPLSAMTILANRMAANNLVLQG